MAKQIKIDENEITKLMNSLGCTREEAISCYMFDNDMEENEEVEALTKKAKENKASVIDCNVTKGVKNPVLMYRVTKRWLFSIFSKILLPLTVIR
jgi:uncharacterized protein involved in tolerance to divalent cations